MRISDWSSDVCSSDLKYLRTPDAAQLLGLSPRILEKHRTFGTGPTYRKLGGRIVYRVDDLRQWADRGVRQSTSTPGAGTVFAARPDRKSVVSGKSVSVRVDLGCCRIIKKKKKHLLINI